VTNAELETFVTDWARRAARYSLAGDVERLQQNENYYRRVMLAHVGNELQREALAVVRRSVFQQEVDRAA
jgi:hypothetical protein